MHVQIFDDLDGQASGDVRAARISELQGRIQTQFPTAPANNKHITWLIAELRKQTPGYAERSQQGANNRKKRRLEDQAEEGAAV